MKPDKLAVILAARYVPDASGRKPVAKLRFSSLAKVFKVPASTIRDVCRAFEKSKHPYKNVSDLYSYVDSLSKKKKCNHAKYRLEEEHLRFLTSQETLIAWATKSLLERTILFHRSYPDKFIKVWRLREVYKQNGIKNKKIFVNKMPIKARDGRYNPLVAEMQRRVQQAIDSKKKIVWLDETVFTKTTCQQHGWSRPNTNFRTPCESLGIKYTAVCATISLGCGIEYFELYDQALNEELFVEYLRTLASKNKRKKLVVFMDNLTVHKTDVVLNLMRELKIEWIWNVPYSPDF